MILKTCDNQRYIAHFSYAVFYPARPKPQMGRDTERGVRETMCCLHVGLCKTKPCNGGSNSSTGIAVCNPKDEFVKATGRKMALAKAMKQLGLARSLRTELWSDYLLQVAR